MGLAVTRGHRLEVPEPLAPAGFGMLRPPGILGCSGGLFQPPPLSHTWSCVPVGDREGAMTPASSGGAISGRCGGKWETIPLCPALSPSLGSSAPDGPCWLQLCPCGGSVPSCPVPVSPGDVAVIPPGFLHLLPLSCHTWLHFPPKIVPHTIPGLVLSPGCATGDSGDSGLVSWH